MAAVFLRPRWLVRHVLVIIVVGTCIAAAIWQVHRLEARRADNARLTSQTRLPVVGLDQLAGAQPADAEYRRVSVQGRFLVDQEVVLQSRSLEDKEGNHLLTPLITSSGTELIVDRGWVPVTVDQPGLPQARPPDGTVILTGVLLPSENKSLFGVSDPPPGRVKAIPRVDLGRLAKQLPSPVYPLYLRLQNQLPANPAALPQPAPLGPLSEGPHLNYAVQWTFFAATALVVYAALLRRELRSSRRVQEEAGTEAEAPST